MGSWNATRPRPEGHDADPPPRRRFPSPPRGGLQTEAQAGGVPGRAGRAPQHHRLGPGHRHRPAGHRGRGQIQGLGRDPRYEGRDRPAGGARHADGPDRPADPQEHAGAGPGGSRGGQGPAGQRRDPGKARRRALQVAVHFAGGAGERGARRRQREGGAGGGAGLRRKRQDRDGGHRRARADHRDGDRQAGGARPGHLLAGQGRGRRHGAAPHGRPQPGPGPHRRGRNRYREDPRRTPGHRHGGRLSESAVRGRGPQDRAPGRPRATVTLDAYPNQPFEGEVLKIEPQAETVQNVTMFPVLIRIQNQAGLLKPGMNSDVEIHIGERDNVLAVPNASLRTQRDVASAASVLGIPDDRLQVLLAAADKRRDSLRSTLAATASSSDSAKADTAKRNDPKPAANTYTTPDGREIPLPAGVTARQVQAVFAKFRNREELSPADRQIMMQLRQSGALGGMGGGGRGAGGGSGGRRPGGSEFQFGGQYIVFVTRNGEPTPVYIRTGLTDLDYSEVVSGLTEKDSVLVLPSASLVQSQQEMKSRFTQMTGGGGVPGMQQARPGATGAGGTSGAAARSGEHT